MGLGLHFRLDADANTLELIVGAADIVRVHRTACVNGVTVRILAADAIGPVWQALGVKRPKKAKSLCQFVTLLAAAGVRRSRGGSPFALQTDAEDLPFLSSYKKRLSAGDSNSFESRHRKLFSGASTYFKRASNGEITFTEPPTFGPSPDEVREWLWRGAPHDGTPQSPDTAALARVYGSTAQRLGQMLGWLAAPLVWRFFVAELWGGFAGTLDEWDAIEVADSLHAEETATLATDVDGAGKLRALRGVSDAVERWTPCGCLLTNAERTSTRCARCERAVCSNCLQRHRCANCGSSFCAACINLRKPLALCENPACRRLVCPTCRRSRVQRDAIGYVQRSSPGCSHCLADRGDLGEFSTFTEQGHDVIELDAVYSLLLERQRLGHPVTTEDLFLPTVECPRIGEPAPRRRGRAWLAGAEADENRSVADAIAFLEQRGFEIISEVEQRDKEDNWDDSPTWERETVDVRPEISRRDAAQAIQLLLEAGRIRFSGIAIVPSDASP